MQWSRATIWKLFEKWMLWVVIFLGVDAFLPIWILFAYLHWIFVILLAVQLDVLEESRDAADPFLKKTCNLIFKKQIFSFNICVMLNTSVQSVFCKYINYIEVFSNESVCILNQYWILVDDVIETSKEVSAGLKMMLTFLSPATCPSSFTFFG